MSGDYDSRHDMDSMSTNVSVYVREAEALDHVVYETVSVGSSDTFRRIN